MPSPEVDQQVAALVASCYHDPLRFVRLCFPWGDPGPLERETGPDVWQAAFLEEIGRQSRERAFDGVTAVSPIRGAVSSGHGVGKTALVAWLICWIMATRPNAQGSVTANTITQLETKTWAALQRWLKLCLPGHWFTINANRMYYTGRKEAWFCGQQSSKEENSEAFAGQHAKDSTSFYIFDEASAIPEEIFQVAEGGLTDGEPMVFLFGNPTRSQGTFHSACFGSARDRWHPVIVDSRDSKLTNKAQIAEWAQDYGEESDFFRVRVLGLPPAASDLQFIDTKTVSAAQRRPLVVLGDDPLVCGLDVARGGNDDCVFRFRRGADARSIPPIRIPGEQARDSMRLVTVAADVLTRTYDGRKVSMLFVDATGIGGPIADRLRQLGHRHVLDVQFGGESPDPKCANMRAFIWRQLRDWLAMGCIPLDPRLEQDLTGPGYTHNKRDQLQLEPKEHMKARGVASPDDGDALALTFAMRVTAGAEKTPAPYRPPGAWQ